MKIYVSSFDKYFYKSKVNPSCPEHGDPTAKSPVYRAAVDQHGASKRSPRPTRCSSRRRPEKRRHLASLLWRPHGQPVPVRLPSQTQRCVRLCHGRGQQPSRAAARPGARTQCFFFRSPGVHSPGTGHRRKKKTFAVRASSFLVGRVASDDMTARSSPAARLSRGAVSLAAAAAAALSAFFQECALRPAVFCSALTSALLVSPACLRHGDVHVAWPAT